MGTRRWMPRVLFRLVVALVLSAEILAAMPVEASPTSARPTPTVAPTRVRSAAPGTPASAPSRLAPTPTRTPTRVTVGRIARVGHLGALFSAPGSPTTGVAWVWGMNQRGELGMPTGTGGASCACQFLAVSRFSRSWIPLAKSARRERAEASTWRRRRCGS